MARAQNEDFGLDWLGIDETPPVPPANPPIPAREPSLSPEPGDPSSDFDRIANVMHALGAKPIVRTPYTISGHFGLALVRFKLVRLDGAAPFWNYESEGIAPPAHPFYDVLCSRFGGLAGDAGLDENEVRKAIARCCRIWAEKFEDLVMEREQRTRELREVAAGFRTVSG